jgi:adenine-specific DNA-methyltransferase
MDKLKMHSPDLVAQNIDKIAELFPNCITEDRDEKGQVKRAVDFDLLRQELCAPLVEGPRERYTLTWPGKNEAILTANAPIAKTLRPCEEESVDFENTKNIFIEGDNLDVLKLLQETYLGKIKMIYIDPPYNTGNDFIYEDDFAEDTESFLKRSNQKDEEGNRLVANSEANGRFHSDWLSMMYPRLKLARNLLRDDGAIFISIDDGEVHNLRKICDEIFGSENFVANIIWQKKTSPDARMEISPAHDHIVLYAKSFELFTLNYLPMDDKRKSSYTNPDDDPRGPWASVDLTGQTGRAPKSQFYSITTPAGEKMPPPDGRCWALAEQTFLTLLKENRIWFGKHGTNRPRLKKFLSEAKGIRPWTWWDNKSVGHNQEGNQELKKLFDEQVVFDNPKPVRLLQRIVQISTNENDDEIILDFFSGSGTTAHSLFMQNNSDNGRRRFILIQLPEPIDSGSNDYKSNSTAVKLGYKTIAEIGKERIRRAGKKVVSDQWEVISKEEKIKYGCKELSRADCMAEGDGVGRGDLFIGQGVAEGGALQSVGSDATGSGVDTIEHSGGAGTQVNQGVLTVSDNNKGLKSGAGNATSSLRESGIPCRYGYFGSDAAVTGDREDGVCSYKDTIHCPLTTNHSPDIGFRVFKVDTSNLKDVYYAPDEVKQEQIELFKDHIKPDRRPEDLLFQVFLDWGLDLALPIAKETIDGKTVFFVDTDAMLACFDAGITEELVKKLAKRKPLRAVFRDDAFGSDSVKINVEQIFKTLSPSTEVKAI